MLSCPLQKYYFCPVIFRVHSAFVKLKFQKVQAVFTQGKVLSSVYLPVPTASLQNQPISICCLCNLLEIFHAYRSEYVFASCSLTALVQYVNIICHLIKTSRKIGSYPYRKRILVNFCIWMQPNLLNQYTWKVLEMYVIPRTSH